MALTAAQRKKQLEDLAKVTGTDATGALSVQSRPGAKPTGSGDPLGTRIIGGTIQQKETGRLDQDTTKTPTTGIQEDLSESTSFRRFTGETDPITGKPVLTKEAQAGTPGFIPKDFTEAELRAKTDIEGIGKEIFDDEDFVSPTTAAERAEKLLKDQEAATARQEEEIRLAAEKSKLSEEITTEKLQRTEEAAASKFLPSREEITSSANLATASGFASGVKKQLELIDLENQQVDFRIEGLRDDLEKAQSANKDSLAKSIASQIDAWNTSKAELALKKAEELEKGETELTKDIISALGDDADLIDDVSLQSTVAAMGGSLDTYGKVKAVLTGKAAIRTAESAAAIAKNTFAEQKNFQDQAFFPMLAGGAFADLSSPATLASLTNFSEKAGFSLETGMALATAQAEGNIELTSKLKTEALTADAKKMRDLTERLKSTSIEALEQFKLVDPNAKNDKAYNARINQLKAGGDIEVVTTASDVEAGKTYNPSDSKDEFVGECGRFVNDVTGIPGLMGSELEDKKSKINSQVPVPGAVFVSNLNQTDAEFGHTGIVESVDLANGTMKIVESNIDKGPDGKGIVSRRTVNINDSQFEGYYVRPDLAQGVKGFYTEDDFVNMIVNLSGGMAKVTDKETARIVGQAEGWLERGLTPQEGFLEFRGLKIEDTNEKNISAATNAIQIGDKLNKNTKPSGFEATVAKYINEGNLDKLDDYVNREVDRDVKSLYGSDAILSADYKIGQDRTKTITDIIGRNKEKVGAFDGRVADFMLMFKDDPEYQELRTVLQMSQASARKYFAGSAVTETEMKALQDFIGGTTKMSGGNLITMIETLQEDRDSVYGYQRPGMISVSALDAEVKEVKKTETVKGVYQSTSSGFKLNESLLGKGKTNRTNFFNQQYNGN